MVNRLLLWAAGSSRLEHAVANNRLLGKTVHRFVAGAQLSDAVSAFAGATSIAVSMKPANNINVATRLIFAPIAPATVDTQ